MPSGTERCSARPIGPRAVHLKLAVVFAIVFAGAALMFAACATTAPPTPELSANQGASEIETQATSEIAPMMAALAARDRALVSMQSEAVMDYTAPDHHVKARENITALRPSSLRVEAMSPFGVALILAAHDSSLEIFEPSQGKLVRAKADAQTLERFVHIPMQPSDAVALLLAVAPGTPMLAAKAPESVGHEGTMLVARWAQTSGSAIELGFEDGKLAMVRQSAAGGEVRYEVRYSQYQDIGGVNFPYAIDASFPLAQSRLVLHYTRPIVNGQISTSIFDLSSLASAAHPSP